MSTKVFFREPMIFFSDGTEALLTIEFDNSPVPPDKNGIDTLGTLVACGEQETLKDLAKKTLSQDETVARKMVGEFLQGTIYPVTSPDKKSFSFVAGIEEYRDNYGVYAICSRGNFPDRMYDVIPIVGFYQIKNPEINAALAKMWREGKIEECQQKAIDLIEDTLPAWNTFKAGAVYNVSITLQDSRHSDSTGGRTVQRGIYRLENAIDIGRKMLHMVLAYKEHQNIVGTPAEVNNDNFIMTALMEPFVERRKSKARSGFDVAPAVSMTER